MKIIGLMSGTSLDGIDAALVDIKAHESTLHLQLLGFITSPLDAELQEFVRAVLPPHDCSTESLCALNFALGEAFAQAAKTVANACGVSMDDVDLIASHGQTVFHQPQPPRSTLQLGEAAIIAERTGCTVVSNFRPRDIAADGQGAPLVPYFDALLFRHETKHRVLLNIGGMANLTYLAPSGELIAFDTGPGNVLINEAVRILTNGKKSFDENGTLAAQGTLCTPLLTELSAHPYFSLSPPKSTGREVFNTQMARRCIEKARQHNASDNDIVATLTQLTACSIAQSIHHFLPRCDEIFVAGGGAHNVFLMEKLQAECDLPLRRTDEIGLLADAKEAIAFAVIGYTTLHGWPANEPSATGATHPVVLGNITPGANYRRLMQQGMQSEIAPRTLTLQGAKLSAT
jgi:anhydro-N-acetylmuramic acid kinase